MACILRCSLALVVGLALLRTAAAESKGLDALAGKDSPLSRGEVIAFFGDSITQAGARPGGYCKLIAESIDKQRPELKVKIVYAGISGHKVPDLQRRLDRDVLSKKPTVVFIYIGINDVWHSLRGRGTSKEKFESGLRELIKKFTAAKTRIVLCTPSTIGEKTDGSNKLDKMLEEYAAISRKVAADTGVTLCDLRKAFLAYLKKHNPDNKPRGVLTGDGVHLNKAGNQFVAAQAAEAIAAALKKRSPSPSPSPAPPKLKPHPRAVPNVHPPGEVDNPKLVPFIMKSPRSLPGIVVDETDAVLVGTWQYSTHTPPYVGLGYLHDQKRMKGKSSATFTPNLPADGVYEVRLSHCYNIRRSTNTPVTIHHADGEKTIRINQQEVPKYKKLFRSLGRFRFQAGKKGWVRISNDGTDGKYVIADAVQFLPVGGKGRQAD